PRAALHVVAIEGGGELDDARGVDPIDVAFRAPDPLLKLLEFHDDEALPRKAQGCAKSPARDNSHYGNGAFGAGEGQATPGRLPSIGASLRRTRASPSSHVPALRPDRSAPARPDRRSGEPDRRRSGDAPVAAGGE